MLTPERAAVLANEIARIAIERVEIEYDRDYPDWEVVAGQPTPWDRALAYMTPHIVNALAGLEPPPEEEDSG